MKIKKFYFVVPILAFAILWQFVSANVINRNLLPAPSDVFVAFLELAQSGELFLHIKTSIWRVLTGLVIGSAAGVLIGIMTGRIKSIDKSLSPIFNVFRSFPPVAIIPLVIVWFGIGEAAKLFSISFAVFFPVWVNAHIGASEIPIHYLQAASTLTCSKIKKFLKIILPASLPFIFAGVRNGISIAYIMVFVSELAGASSGIGYLISVSHLAYRMDMMIAGLLLLGFFGACTDYAFALYVRRLFPWLGKM